MPSVISTPDSYRHTQTLFRITHGGHHSGNGAGLLRLLGNDAAHIESQEYQQVGKEDVELAIEFAKELLKASYQYSALLSRFEALKKVPTSAP